MTLLNAEWKEFKEQLRKSGVGNILGVIVGMQCLALITGYILFPRETNSVDQKVAFLVGTELQLLGLVLLYDLEYPLQHADTKIDHHDYDPPPKPPPIDNLLIPSDVQNPNLSDITQNSDESHENAEWQHARHQHQQYNKRSIQSDTGTSDQTDYTSFASLSTEIGMDYDERDPEELSCIFGISLSYACVFILVLSFSTLLFLASLNQQIFHIEESFSKQEDWARNLFLVTYGCFLAACVLSYCKRCVTELFSANSLCKSQHVTLLLSLGTSMTSFVFFGQTGKERNESSQELHSFLGLSPNHKAHQEVYWGEAWVTEAYTIDERAICADPEDFLSVALTVVYGNDWACPDNSDLQCEVQITTQVECMYYFSVQEVDDDEIEQRNDDAENQKNGGRWSTNDYIYYRYHSNEIYNENDDANAANDDMNQAPPSVEFWNRPTESIVGRCDGVCSARPQGWVEGRFRTFSLLTHCHYLALGMALCFLTWPLLAWWKRRPLSIEQ